LIQIILPLNAVAGVAFDVKRMTAVGFATVVTAFRFTIELLAPAIRDSVFVLLVVILLKLIVIPIIAVVIAGRVEVYDAAAAHR